MDFGTGFPVDLVLFGLVAAFLVLRLRGILGKRTGFERRPLEMPQAMGRPGPTIIEGRAEPPSPPARVLPEPLSTLGQTLDRMRGLDKSFDPARFLDNAEAAFRMIVAAFAAGDRARLATLLSDAVYRSFDLAITGREQAGQTQISDIKSMRGTTIDAAALTGSRADVTVRFVSDQISMIKDAAGQILSGADATTELVELWTFERVLGSPDLAWKLSGVAGG